MRNKPKHDLTGMTFGSLKVIRMEKGKKGFDAICNCLACGKINHRVRSYDLRKGRFKTCGCQAKFRQNINIGERYGYLEVVELIKEDHKYYAICRCHNCGKEHFKVMRASLRSGRTTSCRCRRDQYCIGENNHCFKGYKNISGKYWSGVICGAKRRGLEFSITIEYCWELYEKQQGKCALSGLPILFGKNSTASLDRIDSSIGYTNNNVQWTHKNVNKMKGNFVLNNFIDLCSLIAENGAK
jgi:hypothetical protein